MSRFETLSRDRGVSLVEVLVSLAINAFAMILIAVLFGEIGKMQNTLAEQAKAEQSLMGIAYELQNSIGQAVDLIAAPLGTISAACCTTGQGQVLTLYDGYTPAYSAKPDADTLAVFFREAAASAPATTKSEYLPTGVFYQRQTPLTSGALYIDYGRPGQPVSPRADNMVADGLVGLEINQVRTLVGRLGSGAPEPVTSLRIRYTVRKYRPVGQGDLRWCAAAAMNTAPCRTSEPYADHDRVVVISLRDNYLGDAWMHRGPGRLLDRVHYFRTIVPQRWLN